MDQLNDSAVAEEKAQLQSEKTENCQPTQMKVIREVSVL